MSSGVKLWRYYLGMFAVALSRTQFVMDAMGKKRGVLLSLKQYEKLMDDLHDVAIVAVRSKEKPIALRTMKRRLIRHWSE